MKRINTANRAVDLFGSGKDGFKAAVAGISDATYLAALWMNHVQEALVRTREAAGIAVPADNDYDWFVTSLKTLIDQQSGNYCLDTGIANAYVVAPDPAISAYTDGYVVRFRVAHANGGASTLDAGPGPKPLRNDVDGALVANDLPAGAVATAIYDATLGHFLINSLVPSQALTKAQADFLYLTLTQGDTRYLKGSKRQTVLTGSVDTNGYANAISAAAGLNLTLAATTTPVVVNFAAGFDDAGELNYLARVIADVVNAWTVPANSLSLLYIERNAGTGALTYGYETGIHGNGYGIGYAKTPQVATPRMSANNAPYGTASASTSYDSNYQPWKVFNRTNFDYTDCWISQIGAGTGWLRFDYPEALTIKRYAITMRNDATDRGSPTAWTFEGSNDNGSSWNVLDTKSGQAIFSQAETRTYDIANATAYKSYRINITASSIAGSGSSLTIARFDLYHDKQSFFCLSDWKMYEWGGGTTWTQKQRVFIGDAISGAASITSVVTYAYNGQYTSSDTAVPANGTLMSFNHNLGCQFGAVPRMDAINISDTSVGLSPGSVYPNILCYYNSGTYATGLQAVTTDSYKVATFQMGANGFALIACRTGGPAGNPFGVSNPALWKLRMIVKREW